MPGFVPRKPLGKATPEKFGMSNAMNSPKGSAEQNIVCAEVDNDTRHPVNGKWVKRSRGSNDYNHQL